MYQSRYLKKVRSRQAERPVPPVVDPVMVPPRTVAAPWPAIYKHHDRQMQKSIETRQRLDALTVQQGQQAGHQGWRSLYAALAGAGCVTGR